jgi:hypothetical protein
MAKNVKRPLVCGKRVNKVGARCVYDFLHSQSTGISQVLDDVINNMHLALRLQGLPEAKLRWLHCCESCLKIGHYAFLVGNAKLNVTLPEGLDRRWKVVAMKAIATGMEVAKYHGT